MSKITTEEQIRKIDEAYEKFLKKMNELEQERKKIFESFILKMQEEKLKQAREELAKVQD